MSRLFEELAYESALRSLDKQERVLDEIRARTGLLVAGSSLVASFLGPRAFTTGHSVLLLLALVAFTFTIGSGLYVLMPKENLVFAISGRGLFEGLYAYRDDPAEVYRRLTYDLERFWGENDRILAPLFRWFRLAALGLALEVILLLAAVSDNLL